MEIDLQYIWKSLNRFTESNLPHSGMRIRSCPYRSARFCLLPEYRGNSVHFSGFAQHRRFLPLLCCLYYVKQIRNYPSGHDRDITQKSESSLNSHRERLMTSSLLSKYWSLVSLKDPLPILRYRKEGRMDRSVPFHISQ